MSIRLVLYRAPKSPCSRRIEAPIVIDLESGEGISLPLGPYILPNPCTSVCAPLQVEAREYNPPIPCCTFTKIEEPC